MFLQNFCNLVIAHCLKEQQPVGDVLLPPRFPLYIPTVRKAARPEWILRKIEGIEKFQSFAVRFVKRSLLFSVPNLSPLMMKPQPLSEGRRFISTNLHSWHNFQTFWAALRPALCPEACRTIKERVGTKPLLRKVLNFFDCFVSYYICICFIFNIWVYTCAFSLWIFWIWSKARGA